MTLLGEQYGRLINEDRPDLQTPDHSLGIEVTRAMEESKNVANALLKEMAGLTVQEDDKAEMSQIIDSGYGYGLQSGRYVGYIEYDYWMLAQPLRRIIESKVEKVGSGFYGNFDEYGLYIFCKDNLSDNEVLLTVKYILELQRNLDIRYGTMYLSLIDRLFVCDLHEKNAADLRPPFDCHDISADMCRMFFRKALQDGCA